MKYILFCFAIFLAILLPASLCAKGLLHTNSKNNVQVNASFFQNHSQGQNFDFDDNIVDVDDDITETDKGAPVNGVLTTSYFAFGPKKINAIATKAISYPTHFLILHDSLLVFFGVFRI